MSPQEPEPTAASTTTHSNGTSSSVRIEKDHDCCPDKDDCIVFADSPAPVTEKTPETEALDSVRKLVAEFVGTALLLLSVVGSGIMAENLSNDVGVQLLMNAVATAFALYGLITIFGPVSGANFNPIVSMVDVLYGDMKPTQLVLYSLCQTTGAIAGTILANIIFEEPVTFSEKERYGYHLWISEIVATCTLILVIHGCIRTGQTASVPTVVAGWVGGGYFFTSSTIFANPAVTIGRTFSDTFAGIHPKSMAVFIPMQIIGALLGFALAHLFYPPHMLPATKDDNLYRRVCVIGLKEFIEKASY